MKDKFIGRKVYVIGNHPWAGNCGTVECKETVPVLGKSGYKVNLENGTSCYVFSARQLHVLPGA